MCDFNFMYNHQSLVILILSHYVTAVRWIIQTSTYWFQIAYNSKVWVLGIDCEHPTVETLQVVRKYSALEFEIPKTLFISSSPDNPVFNHNFKLSSRLVKRIAPICLLQLRVICFLKKSHNYVKIIT
jgi:hypothetical protein